jgi:hypothetical protein
MRIKKIKITKDDKVHIEYEIQNNTGNWDEFSLTSADKPNSYFDEAFRNLDRHVIEMCEFGDAPVLTVKGVSFSYGGEKEVMGASIIATKQLLGSNCNLNLVTPHKASEPYGEGKADEKQLLTEDCVADLDKLCQEAEAYIKGNRQQMDLFSQQPAEAVA